MPPVPNVTLVMPGRTHPWPTSEACWSPTSAAIGRRRPSSAGGLARPGRRCRRAPAGRRGGIRSVSSTLSAHPVASGVQQAGGGGVGRVGHVQRTAREVPRHPRVDRAEARGRGCGRGRRRRAGGGPWWPTRSGPARRPSPCRTRQSPTVRRSCQPRPGPTGSPVARSHTIVDARWLVMPTAVDRAAVGERRPGDVQRGAGHLGGVELDEAGRRRGGQDRPVVDGGRRWRRGGRPRRARRLVPTSTTRIDPLMRRLPSTHRRSPPSAVRQAIGRVCPMRGRRRAVSPPASPAATARGSQITT